ncbi:MAG: GNAT family N-acetyltransferase [Myxococcota bacterium]
MTTVRALKIGDEQALESFLAQHVETTMFLRGNLRQAGIEDRGERYQGSYAAAFENGRVVSAAAHYWSGMLVVEAPRALAEVVSCAVSVSGRSVQGILGSWSQLVEARRSLGLACWPTRLDSREELYAIDLGALRVPTALADGSVRCRLPHASELDLLAGWAAAYGMEALEERDGQELRASSRARVEASQTEGRHWLLEAAGRPVAYTAFNAVLPDCVQVGGVFTPPELRGRGYARCAVAGSLIAARQAGALRSVLFTGEENRAAQAAYRALGYERVGDYGIVTFESPEES